MSIPIYERKHIQFVPSYKLCVLFIVVKGNVDRIRQTHIKKAHGIKHLDNIDNLGRKSLISKECFPLPQSKTLHI